MIRCRLTVEMGCAGLYMNVLTLLSANTLSTIWPRKAAGISFSLCNPTTRSVISRSFTTLAIAFDTLKSYLNKSFIRVSVAAAVLTAVCRTLRDCFNAFSSEWWLSITFRANKPFLFWGDLIAKLRLTSSSTVSSLLTGIKICSDSFLFSSLSDISWAAMLWAPFWAAKEAMVQVTSIIRIVPFNTLSFNNRIGSPLASVPVITLYPTITAANVAAACALLKPKITLRWSVDRWKVFWVIQAAMYLAAVATIIMISPTLMVSKLVKNVR